MTIINSDKSKLPTKVFQHTLKSSTELFTFVLFLIVFALQVKAQDNSNLYVSELKKITISNHQDTDQINVLLHLSNHYLFKPHVTQSERDSGFLFVNRAIKLSIVLHALKQERQGMLLEGHAYLVNDDTAHAGPIFKKIISYYHQTKNAKAEAATWLFYGQNVNRSNQPLLKLHTICYQRAEEIYRGIGDGLNAAKMLKEIADDHIVGGKIDQAEKELLEVIKEFNTLHYNKLHYVYDLLASIATLKGDLKKELSYNIEVVRSMENTSDTTLATDFYCGLAAAYRNLKMNDKAILYYQKALRFTHSEHYMYQYYFTVLNIVNLMIGKHDTDKALLLLNKVVTKSPPSVVDDKMFIDEGYGACYSSLGQIEKAKPYYLDLVKLSENAWKANAIAPLDYFVHTMIYIKVLLKENKYQEADLYAQKLTKLPVNKLSPMRIMQLELAQFKIDSAFKNYLPAIEHYKKYTQTKDSVYNISRTKKIDSIEYRYETEKKDRDLITQIKSINNLNKQDQIQKKLVKQTLLVRNFVIGGLIMLILLLGLLYNRYLIKQRSNLILQKQRKEIDSQNESLLILNLKQQALITEKEWLLREIHHRVKNNLQTSMSLLNMQSAHISNNEALNALKDSQRRMQTMSLIHQRLYQSDSMTLIDMSIYVQELIVYLAESFGDPDNIKFEVAVDKMLLDVDQAIPIGLIVNEAITNSLKYAFPDGKKGVIHVSIENHERGSKKLFIRDNGIGFTKSNIDNKTASLGIKLMRGLADQLQGEFDLQTENGTCVTVIFNSTELSGIMN